MKVMMMGRTLTMNIDIEVIEIILKEIDILEYLLMLSHTPEVKIKPMIFIDKLIG